MDPNFQNSDLINQKAKVAARYAWIILIVGIASFTGDLITTLQSHLWQMSVMAGFSLVLVILAALALAACQRKQPNLAAMLLAISGIVLTLSSAFLIDGMGAASGVASIFVTTVIATQVTSPQYRRILPTAGIISGVTAILIQLFIHPSWRIAIVSPIVMGIIIIVSVVTMLGYLFLQFNSFLLRTKLLITLLAVSLTAVSTIAYATNLTTRQALTNSVGERINSFCNSQAITVGDFLSNNLNLIKTLAISPTLRQSTIDTDLSYPEDNAKIKSQIEQLDQQWISAYKSNNNTDSLIQSRLNNPAAQQLNEFQRLYPDHIELLLTDQLGGLVASTNLTPKFNQRDDIWWQAAYNLGRGYTYISSPEYDELSKSLMLIFAMPIYNPETQLISGILRSTLRLNNLVNPMTEKSITSNVELVFRGVGPQVYKKGQLEPMDWNVLDALDKISGKTYAEIQLYGAQSLVSVSQVKTSNNDPSIEQMGYWVVNYQKSDQALAPVQAQTNLIAILAIIISAVVIVIAVIVGTYLARPIMRLTEVAEKVLAGDLTAQAKIDSKDEIGKLSVTFDSMTSRLRETLTGLEQRITDRTRAIEASALVGRRLTTILDQSQLVRAVVEQLQQAFNYYHVQIYLYDPVKENLVMAGGTGEPGRIMLERGHKIQHGAGLVGRASETGTVVLVSDTTTEPNWLPNPLLLETKSEIVVPILMGDEVLGALDVQQNRVNGLTQQDSDLLQLIASQVAVALRNSRLYAEAQRQAEREALVNSIVQQIQQTNTVDEALQTAVRELGRALKVPRTRVRLRMSSANDGQS